MKFLSSIPDIAAFVTNDSCIAIQYYYEKDDLKMYITMTRM